MDFLLTDEQRLFQESVTKFVEREIPREEVRKWDAEATFPYHLYNKIVELGWIGLPFPQEYGGQNAGAMMMALFGEAMGYRGYDLAVGFIVTMFIGMDIIENGTEEQREKYIPQIIQGKKRFSISITEPDAGSDATNLSTQARLEGNEWIINGHKVFSSGAHLKDNIILVACRTDLDRDSSNKRKGISFIMVPNDTPGIEIVPMKTLGRHIVLTNEVFFTDVRVPKENILGPLNGGFKVLTSGLNLERLTLAGLYVGNSQAVVDDALTYAKQRVQFGQPIGKFQAISHMLADMQTRVDAARLLAYRAASLYDAGKVTKREISMAKLFTSETFADLANEGMQIMGGYGYTKEFDMERYYRIARITTIAGGSSQIQRNTIARSMGL